MRLTARFLGRNKSKGYITGQVYVLQILRRGLNGAPEIVSSDPPAQNPVKYGSWEAFYKNWDEDIENY